MRTRGLLSAGMVGAAMLVVGCSKKEPEQTTPEQAAGQAADTTRAAAGAVKDSATAAEGAYRDSAAAAAGAVSDTAAAAAGAVQDTAAARVPDTTGLTPDTTGLGAGADSVRPDSM
jgi:hypothetical protein